MKCPICGAANLVTDTRDLPYFYKGESTVLPGVSGEFCPSCDESVLGPAESRRTMDLMLAFNKRVNAAMVDPDLRA
jgi:HTH-type transcriptional regulator / antitoxin MqsA